MQVFKHRHHAGQGKIHRAQAEDGENIRGIDDKRIQGDRQHGRNRVRREQDIGGLNHQEHHQQRRSIERRSAYEEFSAFIVFRDRYKTAQQAQRRILVRVNLGVLLAEQLDAAVD